MTMRGFTLVEVLVALVLMALISVMGWRALDALGRSHTRIAAHVDDTQTLQHVMGQIERDIRQHASADVLPPLPEKGAPARQNPPALALPPALRVEPQLLALTRAHADGAWQQVHWYVQQDHLYRASGAAATRLPVPAPTPGQAHAVLDDVRAFAVRAWLPGKGWTAPPLPTPSAAADGLEIVLVRAGAQGEETYRKVVLLP